MESRWDKMNQLKTTNSILAASLLAIAAAIISLLQGGCGNTKPLIAVPGSNEHLEVLSDGYFTIKKHYVDPLTPGKLASTAIRGMEEFAASKNSVLRKPVLATSENTTNEEEALKAIGAAFGSFVEASILDHKLLEQAAIKGMIKSLDPHSAFIRPERYKEWQVETTEQFGGIGLQIGAKEDRLVVIAPIEGSPADKAGIKAGDYITQINDRLIHGLNLDPDPDLMDAVQRLRGPIGSKISITLERTGEPAPLSFEFAREIVKIESVKSKVIDNIGYVRVIHFQESTGRDLSMVLKQFKAQKLQSTILDLRNNPGGLVTAAVDVSEQFLPKGRLVFYTKGRENKKDEWIAMGKDEMNDAPMIILVNKGSAGASEIVAGALQDYGRAMIIGASTFGGGTVQRILPLRGGAGLRLTTSRSFTPNGRSLEATIQPDLVVQEEEGLDTPLSSALTELRAMPQR